MNESIILVYPYFKTAAQNLQLFRPMGIAGLASQISELGLTVKIVDCTFMTFEESIREITESNPAIVGISIMVTMSGNAFRLLRKLRKNLPETLFVTGGPMPTVFPERFAGKFDIVFRGESDNIFPKFCSQYINLKNRRDLKNAPEIDRHPGIYFSLNSHIIQRESIHNPSGVFDDLPVSTYSGFNHKAYQEQWMKSDDCKPITLMTTLGCPFNCDFCSKPVFGNDFRKLSLDKLMKEIDLAKNHGYDSLWLADDCFTLDRNHVLEFCRILINKENIKWTCLSRVKGITPDLAAFMRHAGCTKVYLGIESGSDETLALMNKQVKIADVINTLEILYKEDIKAAGFFMVGYPGESPESIEKTFSFALSHPFDEISFNVPYPLPDSPLYNRVKNTSLEIDWEIENEPRFLFRTEFDKDWIKRRIEETMKKFTEMKQEGQKILS